MCGITGYANKKDTQCIVSGDVLIKMRDTLTHRGPDDCGCFISKDKKIGLGHRRLSILDLSEKGRQPMTNEDHSIWITYNGEIYNFETIKNDLINKGHEFVSHSDTEVIIHSYEEYGKECLDLFEGMFAFALFDENKNCLFLARDRFGKKPLYYGFLDYDTFGFASEIKALVSNPVFKKELNYNAIGDFFAYRYIPAPNSIWKNIFKLTHGHYLELDLNKWQLGKETQYYNFVDRISGPGNSSLEEVYFLFKEAVKKRLVSDVEVGTLLSGGIDSASVTALANEIHSGIKAFTIGFDHGNRDEAPFAKEIAEKIGVKHYINYVNDLDSNIINSLPHFYDEPFGDNSLLPTFILSKMTRKYVKVALSGDGGDEVFSGYSWYEKLGDIKNPKKRFIIDHFTNLFNGNIPVFEDTYSKAINIGLKPSLFKSAFLANELRDIHKTRVFALEKYQDNSFEKVRKLQFVDINTFLVDDIFTKVDRASMANSLEVRVPMLDHKLVESVFRLSEADFPSDSTGKMVLKNIMQGKLAKSVLNRPKKGFGAPWSSWKAFDQNEVHKFIINGKAVNYGLINGKFIEKLFRNKRFYSDRKSLFLFYMFEAWFRCWMT